MGQAGRVGQIGLVGQAWVSQAGQVRPPDLPGPPRPSWPESYGRSTAVRCQNLFVCKAAGHTESSLLNITDTPLALNASSPVHDQVALNVATVGSLSESLGHIFLTQIGRQSLA